jgi:hypothetical protein
MAVPWRRTCPSCRVEAVGVQDWRDSCLNSLVGQAGSTAHVCWFQSVTGCFRRSRCCTPHKGERPVVVGAGQVPPMALFVIA